MKKDATIPKLVSVVAIVLGCLDLIRGFLHTILLEHAATNIAGLDLSTPLAGDLLQMMGTFGISNYITGADCLHPDLFMSPFADYAFS